MSYNMKKMHIADWQSIFARCKKNRLKFLNPFFNEKKFVSELYYEKTGQHLNFDNPLTFNEKLNLMKINPRINDNYWRYADKHEVRKYVKKKIGEDYLIPEYLCTKKLKVKDFEGLPDKFVIKTTNGSGTNYIVEDKETEDLDKVVWYMNWLSGLKYGYLWGEFLYNKIEPKIIVEKLLPDDKGNIPDDFKCYCFKDKDGVRRKVLYVERVIGDERFRIMFNDDWEQVDYGSGFGKLDIKIKKPSNYKEILGVVDKLSEDFDFVRVDLFLLDNKIYFGELTFVPTAGFMQLKNRDVEELWGSWIR